MYGEYHMLRSRLSDKMDGKELLIGSESIVARFGWLLWLIFCKDIRTYPMHEPYAR